MLVKRKKTIYFSKRELKDLLTAWVFITLAFAILLSRHEPALFVTNIFISAFTVGLGFLIHEIGHKITAQYYGCWAEFVAAKQMLWLALFMSFLGFIIAAPGAVMISGFVNRKKNGIISAAGPVANIFLSVIFKVLQAFFAAGILKTLCSYGFQINAWLALFNMLPFHPFDGAKVLSYSKSLYIAIVLTPVLLISLA
ncbi:metalloprotease [Candidatus Woesearchaeota archaeon]|nr:metalloprotease [Candidatus Woesearchaeota archaeon]